MKKLLDLKATVVPRFHVLFQITKLPGENGDKFDRALEWLSSEGEEVGPGAQTMVKFTAGAR